MADDLFEAYRVLANQVPHTESPRVAPPQAPHGRMTPSAQALADESRRSLWHIEQDIVIIKWLAVAQVILAIVVVGSRFLH
jgi:hypothetical protein